MASKKVNRYSYNYNNLNFTSSQSPSQAPDLSNQLSNITNIPLSVRRRRQLILGPIMSRPAPAPIETTDNLHPDLKSNLENEDVFKSKLLNIESGYKQQSVISLPNLNDAPISNNVALHQFTKNAEWTNTEYDTLLNVLHKIQLIPVQKMRKNKWSTWKLCKDMMNSGRTPNSIRMMFYKKAKGSAKTTYRHNDFSIMANKIAAFHAHMSDSTGKQILSRHAHTVKRQFEKRQKKKKAKQAEDIEMRENIKTVTNMILADHKSKVSEDKVKDDKDTTITTLRNMIDDVIEDEMKSDDDNITKQQIRTLQKAILQRPDDIILEFKRVRDRYVGNLNIILKLIELSELFAEV